LAAPQPGGPTTPASALTGTPQPIGPGAGTPVTPAGPPQPIGFPVEHPAGTPPQAPQPSHFTASPANRPPLEAPQMGQVNRPAEPAPGTGLRPPLESPQMGQLNRPLSGPAEPSGLSGAPAPAQAFTRQVTHQPGGSFTQVARPGPGTSGLPGAPGGAEPPSTGKPTGLYGMEGSGSVTMPSGLGGAPAAAPKETPPDDDDPAAPSGLPGR
jgi:hypothetical protein